MKLKHLLSGMLLMSTIAFVSCKGKPKDMIVNKWKATDISGGQMAQMPDSIKKNILSTLSIEFTKDGKYITTSGGATDNGTYTLSEDGKTLTMKSGTGRPEEPSQIDEISKTKVVLSEKTSGTKITLEPK